MTERVFEAGEIVGEEPGVGREDVSVAPCGGHAEGQACGILGHDGAEGLDGDAPPGHLAGVGVGVGLVVRHLEAEQVAVAAVAAGEPANVAKYAFQLAQSFNNFYHQYPIIHEPDREKKVFLLWMTEFFRRQLERTLDVLGIEVPEYM